jgi:Flp pilus assembly protein TadD
MRGWAKLAAAAMVVASLDLGGSLPTFAAAESSAAETRVTPNQIEARRQALLHQMLQNPGNLDIAFEYAELSTQVGDYEAAVSTLERMLIYAPGTPRLELELGILYYRLGQLRDCPKLFCPSRRKPERAAANRRQGAALFTAARGGG